METENKFNYARVDDICHSLLDYSNRLAGIYARLSFNNPAHADLEKWKERHSSWSSYRNKYVELVLNSEEEAVAEKNRLFTELRQMQELEKELLNK